MIVTTVTPAYGRDYRSRAAAVADWKAGRDFILEDVWSSWNGKPFSIRDTTPGEVIRIRYAKRARVVLVYPPPPGEQASNEPAPL